ncbi:hypothetical protein LINPERHAP1_LOCUS30324 [Linum perenne]
MCWKVWGFKEGSLPVRYLEVPLISGKLSTKECDQLVARITAKITGWRVRTLSYAGWKSLLADRMICGLRR